MDFLSPPENNIAHKLKILSLNARGLRNTNKRRAIFSYLKDQKAWRREDLYSRMGRKTEVFFSHGTEHSKGVTMLINPASKFQVSIVEIIDPYGRYLITKLQVEHAIFYVITKWLPRTGTIYQNLRWKTCLQNWHHKINHFRWLERHPKQNW